MRILHVIAQKPDHTGSGIYVRNLMRWSGKQGHEQALVAAVDEGDAVPLFLLDAYLVEFGSEKLPFPVPGMSDVMPYPSTPYSALEAEQLQAWEESFEYQLKLARSEFRPDVVLAHHQWLLTAKVREMYEDIPVMAVCHGTDLRQVRKNQHLIPRIVPSLKRLDRIFALNGFQKEEIAELYDFPRENILVTGVGYDDEVFYPTADEDSEGEGRTLRLIYAGKLSRSKGLMSLFRIVRNLRRDLDVRLSLAGSGDLLHWQELAPEGVEFLGRLSQEDLAAAFRESDLFVLPSYYEGLPLVSLEALGSGLPVVMSDIPGIRRWLGPEIVKSGYLELVTLPAMEQVDEPVAAELPGFEERFEQAVRRLLAQKKDAGHMQTLARQKSWNQVFERIERECSMARRCGCS